VSVQRDTAARELERILELYPGLCAAVVRGRNGYAIRVEGFPRCGPVTLEVGLGAGETGDVLPDPPRAA